jgi:hypothetical protein
MKRMKIIYYVILVLVLGTSSLGCKKSSDTPSGTKWTLNGATHGVDAIVYYTFETYTAINPLTGDYINIYFDDKYYSPSVLPAAGTYSVISYSVLVFPSNNVVSIDVGNQNQSNSDYYSTGVTGDVVTVSVSPAGKHTFTFNNVTVKKGTETATLSGTVVED